MIDRISPVPGHDDGMSLVELLVSMLLLTAISAFVSMAFIESHRVLRTTDDTASGLSDVRVAAERLARDVREASSVLCNPAGTSPALAAADPTCIYHLQLWIDENANYRADVGETVTWQLLAGAIAGHYDLIRAVTGGAGSVEASTIVEQVAFSYDVQPGATAPPPGATHTTSVDGNVTYDALQRTGSSRRTVSFSGRLRNVS